jgi:hypothetical protein
VDQVAKILPSGKASGPEQRECAWQCTVLGFRVKGQGHVAPGAAHCPSKSRMQLWVAGLNRTFHVIHWLGVQCTQLARSSPACPATLHQFFSWFTKNLPLHVHVNTPARQPSLCTLRHMHTRTEG